MIDIEIMNAKPIDIDIEQKSATNIERVAGGSPDVTTWQGILGRPFTYLSSYFYTENGLLCLFTAEDIAGDNNLPATSKAVYEAIRPLAERVANVKDGKDGLDGKDGKDGRDGYTPVKGIDYVDGKDGKDGQNGKDFKYEDFTPEQLAKLKGEKGDKGDAGTIDERTQGIIVNEVLAEIPAWAKETHKPTYTASEVGALPDTTVIPTVPTNVSAFNNDAGYLTEHQSLSSYALKSEIPSDSHINDLINTALGVIENGTY